MSENCTTTPYTKKDSPYTKKDSPVVSGIEICPYIALEQGGLLKTEDNKFILVNI